MLDVSVFDENMEKISEAFGSRWTEKKAEAYYEHVSHLPNEAFEDICKDWIKQSSSFPRIADLLRAWHDWRDANRNKTVSGIEKSDCKECGGEGCLYGIKNPDGEYPYETMFYCSMCRNARSKDAALDKHRYTKSKIIERGYQLSDGNGNLIPYERDWL